MYPWKHKTVFCYIHLEVLYPPKYRTVSMVTWSYSQNVSQKSVHIFAIFILLKSVNRELFKYIIFTYQKMKFKIFPDGIPLKTKDPIKNIKNSLV